MKIEPLRAVWEARQRGIINLYKTIILNMNSDTAVYLFLYSAL